MTLLILLNNYFPGYEPQLEELHFFNCTFHISLDLLACQQSCWQPSSHFRVLRMSSTRYNMHSIPILVQIFENTAQHNCNLCFACNCSMSISSPFGIPKARVKFKAATTYMSCYKSVVIAFQENQKKYMNGYLPEVACLCFKTERTRLRLFLLNLMQICTSNRLKQLIKVIKHCGMRSHKNIYQVHYLNSLHLLFYIYLADETKQEQFQIVLYNWINFRSKKPEAKHHIPTCAVR